MLIGNIVISIFYAILCSFLWANLINGFYLRKYIDAAQKQILPHNNFGNLNNCPQQKQNHMFVDRIHTLHSGPNSEKKIAK